MKVLDLFSGIGGFSLGLKMAGHFETVAFCEIDPWCRKILNKNFPDVPVFEDVTKLKGDEIGTIDLICGGYPCQPFSMAGERKGKEDDRHLWPEFMRLVVELRPTWVIGENVAGHISMGLDDVLSDLETQGYTCRPFVIPACALDAKHRRDRIWIIGHANSNCKSNGAINGKTSRLQDVANTGGRRCGKQGKGEVQQPRRAKIKRTSSIMANANSINAQGVIKGCDDTKNRKITGKRPVRLCYGEGEHRKWPAEPRVGRVAHGIPNRVDRLRGLGNAVVPQIVAMIGTAILEAEREAA